MWERSHAVGQAGIHDSFVLLCGMWLIALYPWVKSWPKSRQWKTAMTLTPDILLFLNKVSQTRFLINQVWEKESSYDSLKVVVMFWAKGRAVTEG